MYFSQVIIIIERRVTGQHRIFYERVAVGRLPQRALAPAAREGGREGGHGLVCCLEWVGLWIASSFFSFNTF